MNKGMNTKKLTLTAMFTALVFIGTIIAIPIPKTAGYMNLGDSVIIICAVLLGSPWAAFAGAIGATIADMSLGFYIYAPFTFLIKGLMGLIIGMVAKNKSFKSIIKAAIIGGIVMVSGYFFSEWLILPIIFGEAGFSIALTGIPFNIIQAVVNGIIAVISIKYIKKYLVKID